MRLYLDEDAASTLLVSLLSKAGHDVQVPASVGMMGQTDPLQLVQSIRELRSILSYNYRDFEHLHLLVREAQGRHLGILVVRREDDPKKNMSPRDIVRAIHNLEAASVPTADEYHVLNHWR